MKKFLATILAIVYLTSSFGATLHLHYCMGKLISWGLFDNNHSKSCTFCNMPKEMGGENYKVSKKGCCRDEEKRVKNDKDQKMVSSEYQFSKFSPEAMLVHDQNFSGFYIFSYLIAFPKANAPPRTGQLPVFLLNCNFRI